MNPEQEFKCINDSSSCLFCVIAALRADELAGRHAVRLPGQEVPPAQTPGGGARTGSPGR